jgi:hypothetical protein
VPSPSCIRVATAGACRKVIGLSVAVSKLCDPFRDAPSARLLCSNSTRTPTHFYHAELFYVLKLLQLCSKSLLPSDVKPDDMVSNTFQGTNYKSVTICAPVRYGGARIAVGDITLQRARSPQRQHAPHKPYISTNIHTIRNPFSSQSPRSQVIHTHHSQPVPPNPHHPHTAPRSPGQ